MENQFKQGDSGYKGPEYLVIDGDGDAFCVEPERLTIEED